MLRERPMIKFQEILGSMLLIFNIVDFSKVCRKGLF